MKTITTLLLVTAMSISAAFADTSPNSTRPANTAANSTSAFENFSGMEQLHSLSAQEKKLAGGFNFKLYFIPTDPLRVFIPVDPIRVLRF